MLQIVGYLKKPINLCRILYKARSTYHQNFNRHSQPNLPKSKYGYQSLLLEMIMSKDDHTATPLLHTSNQAKSFSMPYFLQDGSPKQSWKPSGMEKAQRPYGYQSPKVSNKLLRLSLRSHHQLKLNLLHKHGNGYQKEFNKKNPRPFKNIQHTICIMLNQKAKAFLKEL